MLTAVLGLTKGLILCVNFPGKVVRFSVIRVLPYYLVTFISRVKIEAEWKFFRKFFNDFC